MSGGQGAVRASSSILEATPSSAAPAKPRQRYIVGCGAPTIGISISGSEYSYGTYPVASELDYFRSRGISLIRLAISWELMQSTLNGPLNQTYLTGLEKVLSAAAARGIRVIVDLHSWGRYHGGIGLRTDTAGAGFNGGNPIGSTAVPISAFVDLWTKLAGALKNQPGVYAYDIMNEPHDMGGGQRGDVGGSPIWTQAAQAAVNGIRSVDMHTTIMVEGTQYSSAAVWLNYNANFILNDPANKLVYQAHQYFDGVGGGGKYTQTYDQYHAYPTIGVDLLKPWLNWLQQHNLQGFLGEFGVPNNDPRWLDVLERVLTKLKANGISGTMFGYRVRAGFWPHPLFLNPTGGHDSPQMTVLMAHTWPTVTSFTDSGHTAPDVSTMTGIAVAGSTLQLFDGTSQLATQLATTTANSTGSWSLNIKQWPFGERTFKVTATSPAGSTPVTKASIAVTIRWHLGLVRRCIVVHHRFRQIE